jgi:hypothetical protein
MTPLESGDPVGTWQRLVLDFRHQHILDLIADGPVVDTSAPDELRERVAEWIEMTAADEQN